MLTGGRPSKQHPPVWREWSAKRTLSPRQRTFALAFVLVCAVGLAAAPVVTVTVWLGAITLIFILTTAARARYFLRALGSPPDPDEGPPGDPGQPLPRYSVMVPLYREANMVPELFAALDRLRYPRDRLEIMILTEHDDIDTRRACEQHLRAGWLHVVVPPGQPRTKPRALSFALPRVSGALFTIYDAEDRPEPDQLEKAVEAFRRRPERVVALQARLDFYNSRQNLLTKWFTCDYATNFGLLIRGIARLGHAMPLGGTSTHFRTYAVRMVGAWDPHNVTEDCELGMRLAAAGFGAEALDSVTYEEAVSTVGPWLRQRSRWIKGFAQTGLVLTRFPLRTARTMGGLRYAAALTIVGGVPLVLIFQGFFWAALWSYVGLRSAGADVSWLEAMFPEPMLTIAVLSFLVGNFAVLLASLCAVYQEKRYDLMRYSLAVPVYWLLASVAAVKALSQLVTKPHFWEKTLHGLSNEQSRLASDRPGPSTRLIPAADTVPGHEARDGL